MSTTATNSKTNEALCSSCKAPRGNSKAKYCRKCGSEFSAHESFVTTKVSLPKFLKKKKEEEKIPTESSPMEPSKELRVPNINPQRAVSPNKILFGFSLPFKSSINPQVESKTPEYTCSQCGTLNSGRWCKTCRSQCEKIQLANSTSNEQSQNNKRQSETEEKLKKNLEENKRKEEKEKNKLEEKKTKEKTRNSEEEQKRKKEEGNQSKEDENEEKEKSEEEKKENLEKDSKNQIELEKITIDQTTQVAIIQLIRFFSNVSFESLQERVAKILLKISSDENLVNYIAQYHKEIIDNILDLLYTSNENLQKSLFSILVNFLQNGNVRTYVQNQEVDIKTLLNIFHKVSIPFRVDMLFIFSCMNVSEKIYEEIVTIVEDVTAELENKHNINFLSRLNLLSKTEKARCSLSNSRIICQFLLNQFESTYSTDFEPIIISCEIINNLLNANHHILESFFCESIIISKFHRMIYVQKNPELRFSLLVLLCEFANLNYTVFREKQSEITKALESLLSIDNLNILKQTLLYISIHIYQKNISTILNSEPIVSSLLELVKIPKPEIQILLSEIIWNIIYFRFQNPDQSFVLTNSSINEFVGNLGALHAIKDPKIEKNILLIISLLYLTPKTVIRMSTCNKILPFLLNSLLTVDQENQKISLVLIYTMAKSGIEIRDFNCTPLLKIIFSDYLGDHKLISCSILLSKIVECGYPSKISSIEKQLSNLLTPKTKLSPTQLKGFLKILESDCRLYLFDSLAVLTEAEPISVKYLTNYITQFTEKPLEQIRFFYRWITHHLQFDPKISLSNSSFVDIHSTLINKSRNSHELARLFLELTSSIGIQCEVIQGYSKLIQTDTHYSPHYWNSIKLNGELKFVDCSLGNDLSPFQNSNRQRYHSFFNCEPIHFISSHFCKEKKIEWFKNSELLQSLPNSLDEFSKKPFVSSHAYLCGLELVSPTIYLINCEMHQELVFKFHSSSKIQMELSTVSTLDEIFSVKSIETQFINSPNTSNILISQTIKLEINKPGTFPLYFKTTNPNTLLKDLAYSFQIQTLSN